MDPVPHKEALQHEAWRVLRIMSEFVESFETLAELGPSVSVFGSSRLGPEDHYRPQHLLYFLPLPQGQGSLRPTRGLKRRRLVDSRTAGFCGPPRLAKGSMPCCFRAAYCLPICSNS